MLRPSTEFLECVPNFSVGPDHDTLRDIEASFLSIDGVSVLDIHTDLSHNRSVFTVVGGPRALQDATFEAVRVAIERIDLREHHGQHPRIGAADVIPFIAIPPTPNDVAIRTAREFGDGMAHALDLPVYLYELATMSDKRITLPALRRRGFEWLRAALETGNAAPPDAGPNRLHPTAGASIIGARHFLIAFNINLNTQDIRVATAIARNVRASSGGHAGIRALGLQVGAHTQVSMNLFNLDVVTIPQAFALVDRQANMRGVTVHSSEIVGLAPHAALTGFSAADIKLPRGLESYSLETRIEQTAFREQ